MHGICTAGNGFLLGGVDIENELQSLYAGYGLSDSEECIRRTHDGGHHGYEYHQEIDEHGTAKCRGPGYHSVSTDP